MTKFNIATFLKQYGFVFPSSMIYGGLANSFDYGPHGVRVINNIKAQWLEYFVRFNPNIFEIDSKIILNPKVWKASGHIDNFSDLMIENKFNHKRYRADTIISEIDKEIDISKMSTLEIENYIKNNIPVYDSAKTEWGELRKFNLMFETYQGVIEGEKSRLYLRPETAQGIFINFSNVQRAMRAKIPFGVAQIGKAFRNEITPGNFLFRTREFEQMEIEYFVNPNNSDEAFNTYLKSIKIFLKHIELPDDLLRVYEHSKDSLAHYSKRTVDIEFKFSFGWQELLGLANRGDFDLKTHEQFSKQNLHYLDPFTKEKFIPHIIEPSFGVDRLFLAIIESSYKNDGTREFLKLPIKLSPYKLAILPLNKNKHSEKAKSIFNALVESRIDVIFDASGSIGKRYIRQDVIGTPYSITTDDETLTNNTVTIRDRNTTKQIVINITELESFITDKLNSGFDNG